MVGTCIQPAGGAVDLERPHGRDGNDPVRAESG
jgi:hypothetical protein